jgi:hypothetical protein
MDAKNNTKTKIKNDLTPQLEKLDEATSTEIIFMENKQDLPENVAETAPRNTCEAVGCYSQASTTVHLKDGTKGIIPLFLCKKCRSELHLDEVSADMS